jgi:hypothetical protein
MQKKKIFILLLFSFKITFNYAQSIQMNDALTNFYKRNVIGKELKKIDIISQDSFTQRSFLLKEILQHMKSAHDLKLMMEARNNQLKQILSKITALEKQKKRSSKLENDFEILNELITDNIKDLNSTLEKANELSELASMADSSIIIRREIYVKFTYTTSLDNLSIVKYNISFGKEFILIYGRKDDD